MEPEAAVADTQQEGHLIEMNDGAQPVYFSARVGRDQASPSGGWTSDKSKGLAFARRIDAADFMKTFLPHMEGTAQVKLHIDLRRRS